MGFFRFVGRGSSSTGDDGINSGAPFGRQQGTRTINTAPPYSGNEGASARSGNKPSSRTRSLALLWHQSPYNDSFVVIPLFWMFTNALVAGLTAAFITRTPKDAEEGSAAIDVGIRMLGLVSNASISIVTLTFSLTVLSVQVAAQSYSPRLLDDFVRDPVSKIVISTNLGAYVYCYTLNGFLTDKHLTQVPFVSIHLLSVHMAIVLVTFVAFIHVFINGFR